MRINPKVCGLGFGVLLPLGSTLGHADYFETDLVDAAKRGDYHAVHRLIEDSPDVIAVTDSGGYTALHWAGIRGHWRIFTDLAAAGAPVNAVGGDGGTPLHWTCHHDRADMVALLLDAGSVESIVLHFLRRSVEGTKTPSPQYVGSTACKSCHADAVHGNPYVRWMQSEHGHAYWRLGADWALFLAKLRPHYVDLEHPISDDRCLLCHVTGRQDDDALFADSFRKEEGVSCESCHGPGSLYVDPEIMTNREAFLAAGGRIPDENTCRGCHRRSEQFDIAEMWPKMAHGGEE